MLKRIAMAVGLMLAGGSADAAFLTGSFDARVSGALQDVRLGPNGAETVDASFSNHAATFTFRVDTVNATNNSFSVADLVTGRFYAISNDIPDFNAPLNSFTDSPAGQGADIISGRARTGFGRGFQLDSGIYTLTDPTGRYISGSATTAFTDAVTLSGFIPINAVGSNGLGQFGRINIVRSAAVPEPSSLVLCGVAGLVGFGWHSRRRRA